MMESPRFLLDTTALIDFAKGFEPAHSKILGMLDRGDQLAICCVSAAEFFTGLCVLSVSWGMPPPQSRQLGGAGLGGSGRLVRNQGGETR